MFKFSIDNGYSVQSVDPSGAIAAAIDPQRIIGCVVYPAATIVAPGVIKHIEDNRFPLGELDGSETPRVVEVSKAFISAVYALVKLLSKTMSEEQVCVRASPPSLFDALKYLVEDRTELAPLPTLRHASG